MRVDNVSRIQWKSIIFAPLLLLDFQMNRLRGLQVQISQHTRIVRLLCFPTPAELLIVVIQTTPVICELLVAVLSEQFEELEGALRHHLPFIEGCSWIFCVIPLLQVRLKIFMTELPQMVSCSDQY